MGWKGFLKPTFGKIAVFLIIFVYSFLINPSVFYGMYNAGSDSVLLRAALWASWYIPLLSFIFLDFVEHYASTSLVVSIFFLFALSYWYALSCLIMWIHSKLNPKANLPLIGNALSSIVKSSLKPKKRKVVLLSFAGAIILLASFVVSVIFIASQITLKEEIYGKGEAIKFSIYDNVQIFGDDLPFSIIGPDGEPVKLKHSCIGFAGFGFDQYCENGKKVSEEVFQLCDFSERWCSRCSDVLDYGNEEIRETFIWDQKEYVEVSEECEGESIRREIKEHVPEGKYQIIVNGEAIKKIIIKGKQAECSSDSDCATAGCSGQLCVKADGASEIITTCEYKEEYGCLKLTSCGCSEGRCSWAANKEYESCMDGIKNK